MPLAPATPCKTMLWKLFRLTYSFESSLSGLIGIWDPSTAPTTWGKRLMSWNSCMVCLVVASVLRNFIKSFALRNKAVQNSSFTFIAVHRLIPKVSPTFLYEFPVANLQRATATRFYNNMSRIHLASSLLVTLIFTLTIILINLHRIF